MDLAFDSGSQALGLGREAFFQGGIAHFFGEKCLQDALRLLAAHSSAISPMGDEGVRDRWWPHRSWCRPCRQTRCCRQWFSSDWPWGLHSGFRCQSKGGSVLECRFDELPVHTGDVGDVDFLGAFGFAFAFIGAVAESQPVHGPNHALHASGRFGTPLGQQGQMGNLGSHEIHGRGIGTRGHTGTAADAGGGIHGFVRVFLRHRDGVGIRSPASIDRDVAAGLDDGVQRGSG